MPDVGLTTAAESLPEDLRVVIKFSVEVEGLPVYNESYDVAKLAKELQEDETRTLELWARRLRCVIESRHKPGFSSSLTRCLVDGRCGDYGFEKCVPLDNAGVTAKSES